MAGVLITIALPKNVLPFMIKEPRLRRETMDIDVLLKRTDYCYFLDILLSFS